MHKIFAIFLMSLIATSCAGDPNRDVVYLGKLIISKEAYEEGLIKEAHSTAITSKPPAVETLEICFLLNKENKLECVKMDPAYLKGEKVAYDREDKFLFNFVAKPQDISLKEAKLIGPLTSSYHFKDNDRIKTSTPNRADLVYLGDFLVRINEVNSDPQKLDISFFSDCNPEFLDNKIVQNQTTKKTLKVASSCFKAGGVVHTKNNGALTIFEIMEDGEAAGL